MKNYQRDDDDAYDGAYDDDGYEDDRGYDDDDDAQVFSSSCHA